jgi:hypothetical protein
MASSMNLGAERAGYGKAGVGLEAAERPREEGEPDKEDYPTSRMRGRDEGRVIDMDVVISATPVPLQSTNAGGTAGETLEDNAA